MEPNPQRLPLMRDARCAMRDRRDAVDRGPRQYAARPQTRLDADVLTADAIRPTGAEKYDMGLISVLIGVLVIVVVGAICFWAIDKFANDRRLANLLKLLVVLICLGAILQRVLPLTY
jgi:hypothetical protein